MFSCEVYVVRVSAVPFPPSPGFLLSSSLLPPHLLLAPTPTSSSSHPIPFPDLLPGFLLLLPLPLLLLLLPLTLILILPPAPGSQFLHLLTFSYSFPLSLLLQQLILPILLLHLHSSSSSFPFSRLLQYPHTTYRVSPTSQGLHIIPLSRSNCDLCQINFVKIHDTLCQPRVKGQTCESSLGKKGAFSWEALGLAVPLSLSLPLPLSPCPLLTARSPRKDIRCGHIAVAPGVFLSYWTISYGIYVAMLAVFAFIKG